LVKDERVITALQKHTEGYIGLFLRRNLDVDTEIIESVDQIHKIGTFAQVKGSARQAAGLRIFVTGIRRVTMGQVINFGPPMMGSVEHWKPNRHTKHSNEIKAYLNELRYAVR
jgi:ATP-dependent Lon protease